MTDLGPLLTPPRLPEFDFEPDLDRQKFLVLDCQTTGLTPAQGHLLEIAWCVADASGSPIEPVQSHLLQLPPGAFLPRRIQELTGICERDMASAIAVGDALARMNRMAGELGVTLALIHYAQFEKAFLLPTGQFSFNTLCTYQMAKRLHPNLPTRNIRGLAGYYGYRTGELKRASAYLQATLRIWQGLAGELRAAGISSVPDLRTWLETPTTAKRAGRSQTRVDGKIQKPPKRPSYEYPLAKDKRLKLPDVPGVYRMLGRNGEILYVGKATSLKSRVNSYFRGRKGRDSHKLEMLTQVWDLRVTECQSPLEAALLENDEIKRHNPPYNISLKSEGRHLLFYSRDFSSASFDQSRHHPLGPFMIHNPIEPMIFLADSLAQGQIYRNVFYQIIPDEDLAQGFALFCERYRLSESSWQSPRGLLALGLRLYRKLRREHDRERGEQGSDSGEHRHGEQGIESGDYGSGAELVERDDVRTEEDATDEDAVAEERIAEEAIAEDPMRVGQELAVQELTVPEIVGKFERLLMRAAKAYLRAKTLTALLNVHVEWKTARMKKPGRLTIENGQVVQSPTTPGSYPSGTHDESPWQGHDMRTYDRMAILLSELAKAHRSTEVTTNSRAHALSELFHPVEILRPPPSAASH